MPEKKKAADFQKAWGKVIAKAWTDELFKQRLLKNPKAVLDEYGIHVSDNVRNIKIHENSRDTLHLVLREAPHGHLSQAELEKIAAGFWEGPGHVPGS